MEVAEGRHPRHCWAAGRSSPVREAHAPPDLLSCTQRPPWPESPGRKRERTPRQPLPRKDPTSAAGGALVHMVQQWVKCLRTKWPRVGHKHHVHSRRHRNGCIPRRSGAPGWHTMRPWVQTWRRRVGTMALVARRFINGGRAMIPRSRRSPCGHGRGGPARPVITGCEFC